MKIIFKLKRIYERWNSIKKLIDANEYFLGITNIHNEHKNIIIYDYDNNTDRELFYKFINDHIMSKIYK